MNQDYKKDELASWVNNKAHNWLIHKAFEFIRSNMASKMPPGLEERYVHYGVSFADRPWYGRPESFDGSHPNGKKVNGVRDDLWGDKISDDCAGFFNNICVGVRYPPGSTPDKPNLYLVARWVFSMGQEIIFPSSGRPECAVDNIAHYLNGKELRGDGTLGSTARLAAGPYGRGAWKIKAPDYGAELYRLAREFWPGAEPIPNTFGLIMVSYPGRLLNESWPGELAFFERTAEADVELRTWLGGNPFISASKGGPTWPIWLPETYSVAELTREKPPQQKRAAAVYLGWALHMLHDLAVPPHISNETGNYHEDTENEIDKWIQEGKYSHLPVLSPWTGAPGSGPGPGAGGEAKYKYSAKKVYRADIVQDWMNEGYKVADSALVGKFSGVASYSKPLVNNVHPDRRSGEGASIAAYEYLLDIALKETIELIMAIPQAVEMGFQGRVMGIKRIDKPVPVGNATIKVAHENGAITKTASTDSTGYFRIDLPKSGKYTMVFEHPDFRPLPYQPSLSLLRPGYLNAGEYQMLSIELLQTGIRGYVSSKVGNISSPLGGARVKITGPKVLNTVTATSGEFLASLPLGKYNVEASHEDYGKMKKDAVVPADRYVSVGFQLKSNIPPGGHPR